MPRKRRKPSNTTRSHLDYGLHKKVKDHTKSSNAFKAYADKAAAKSKTSGKLKGMDNVDYDGRNRQEFNLGRAIGGAHKILANKAQSEIDKRNEKRKRNALRIRGRQRPLQ